MPIIVESILFGKDYFTGLFHSGKQEYDSLSGAQPSQKVRPAFKPVGNRCGNHVSGPHKLAGLKGANIHSLIGHDESVYPKQLVKWRLNPCWLHRYLQNPRLPA
jgi:hypothetical protein